MKRDDMNTATINRQLSNMETHLGIYWGDMGFSLSRLTQSGDLWAIKRYEKGVTDEINLTMLALHILRIV